MTLPHHKIIALANDGVQPAMIAARLSLTARQVHNSICNARRRGIEVKRFGGSGKPVDSDTLAAVKPQGAVVIGERLMSMLNRRAEAEGISASELARRFIERSLLNVGGRAPSMDDQA